jgi:hypothetical protein
VRRTTGLGCRLKCPHPASIFRPVKKGPLDHSAPKTVTSQTKNAISKIFSEKFTDPRPTYNRVTQPIAVTELVKLSLLLAGLMFLLPICLYATFWSLAALASGNLFPFIFCLTIALYFIGRR